MAAAITLADLGWTEPPAVVAIGASATGGELLALGSRASMLFLVDGLGGRWPASAEETIAAEAAYARRLADDPAAVGPAPAEGVDPRPRHGFTPRTDRAFVERLRRQIPVPVVVIETPASVTHPSEVEERAAMFDPPAAVIELDDSEPGAVLAAVVSHLVR
jgi:hypothetical protein